MTSRSAIIPVRGGVVPKGTLETVAEAHGRCWLVGSDAAEAVDALNGTATEVTVVELGDYVPHEWAAALADALGDDGHLLLPHGPDGRDLAPRLAVALSRPLVSAAVVVGDDAAVLARTGGLTMTTVALDQPVVATFQIGARTTPATGRSEAPVVVTRTLASEGDTAAGSVRLLEEIPADPATIDLAEAGRIIGAGVGIGSEAVVADVETLAELLDASVGATRVITDWGWLPTERQIGTTGVTVDPDLYIAVGISGAVQHTAGLGDPEHVIVVNTDSSCPMMELADLALVCDGPAFLTALGALLSARPA